MLRTATFCLAFALPVLAAPAPSRQEAEQRERKHLEGVWRVAAAWQQGRRMPAELYRGVYLVFAGDRIWDRSGAPEDGMTFRLDPLALPHRIDLTPPATHKACPGIYRLSGDHLILCWDGEGVHRPNQLLSAPGSRVYLFELVRVRE
jgi:uncharacterized protein (TIGR03067 family)